MATPNAVSAPYGFRPVNLIGGQPFAGSTRMYPIQYGYATNIFNGDHIVVTKGNVTKVSNIASTSSNATTGIFLGCTYTDPTSKQKLFSQYWPASTLSGDGMAYVCDDPTVVLKAAICSSGTTMASGAVCMLGRNLNGISNAGSTATGNSKNSLLAPTDTPVDTLLPFRVVAVVKETALTYSATGSSSGTTLTLTGSGSPAALPVGTDVAYYASNGQLIQTGSFLDTACSAGDTSLVLNAAIDVPGSVTSIPASSTVVFTIYRELLVKMNPYYHGMTVQVTA